MSSEVWRATELSTKVSASSCLPALQRTVRRNVDFGGKLWTTRRYPLCRQVVAFDSGSDQALSHDQSVRRSTLNDAQKCQGWYFGASDKFDKRGSSVKNLLSENATSAQSRLINHEIASSPFSGKRSGVSEAELGTEARSLYPRSRSAGGRPPLTDHEEAEYVSHVQDLLALEAKNVELEEQLGRVPTVQEWADAVGISVFALYARVGRGRASQRKMVEANTRLVHSVAQQFHGRGLSHDELCQQGYIGLLKSSEKFDRTRSTKFSSYAFFGVKNQMRIASEKFGRELRIGQTVYANISKLLGHKDDFVIEHGRQPTSDELKNIAKMSAKKIRETFRTMPFVKSLEASEAGSSESSIRGGKHYLQQLTDHSFTCNPWAFLRDGEQKTEVIRVLSSLTPHQQEVMHLRYGLGGHPPLLRSEVALVLGVSSTAVLCTEKRALDRLRELALEEGLLNYLNDSFWN
ncbi:uncharacterized protein [Physcomitrium patens]|uniref:Uncharacterized protein n=1 Tax=Physcomitrium patens TaxID=3218 RepID=A0A2K1J7U7_PHYPA|nr:uncharacterized protein LOC112293952 [Physcomitrium patens]XP_024399751.1 uncharacterized protein LOC112293952 [Physcomitrium patens]PNR37610.1 hypothetical protein PHYPA_020719 [Physcomitrium patens]|eukprot:XP_024399750.1 uncharacterized protein LOC112293952 [Physcomitrella patens]